MDREEALNQILRSLGTYRLEEKHITLSDTYLGRGGFGIVQLGNIVTPEGGSELVAVKQLYATGAVEENKKMALALAQELHVWAGLAHRNILPLVGFYLDERFEKAWLVAPYMKQGNIRQYLDHHRPTMIIRLRMLREIVGGIAYLHRRNLCHGDVKGANILVDDDSQAILCDFGLTKLMESGTTLGTMDGGMKGTIRYMAPELFNDPPSVRSMKSDVWAVGCLGLEVLFDRVPYDEWKTEATSMLRIMQGYLPLNLEDAKINDSIKWLFKQCWVAEPDGRVDIKTCAKGMEDVMDSVRRQAVRDEASGTIHQAVFNSGSTHQNVTLLRRSGEVLEGLPSEVNYFQGSDVESQEPPHRAGGNSDQGDKLYDLAISLWDKYVKGGNFADLNEAIEVHRQALLLRPEGHPKRFISLENLASSLLKKYSEKYSIIILDEVIDFRRQALLLRPEGSPQRLNSLERLTASLWEKYCETYDSILLDEIIDLRRQALVLRPEGHPDRYISLDNLAISLREKYWEKYSIPLLDEVFSLRHQALLLRPKDDPERSTNLDNLAASLREKRDKEQDIALIDDVINLRRRALTLQPKGHPARFISLNDLAVSLLEKYGKNSDIELLEEVIGLRRQALLLRPTGHPERLISLDNLAGSLQEKYGKGQEIGALDEAICLYREALGLLPRLHPKRSDTLHTLAMSLRDKYHKQGDIMRLDEAIGLLRHALALRPEGHPERLATLDSLAILLRERYDKEGESGFLDDVIGLQRQALVLQSKGYPARFISLNDLAVNLDERFRKRGDITDLDEEIGLYRQVLRLPLLHQSDRVDRHYNLFLALGRRFPRVKEEEVRLELVSLCRRLLDWIEVGDQRRPGIEAALVVEASR